MPRTIRIGCASAFWGDTSTAAAQLVERRATGLSGVRLPGRNHPVDHGRRPDERSPGRIRRRLHRSPRAVAAATGANTKSALSATPAGSIPKPAPPLCKRPATRPGSDLKIAVLLGDDLQPQFKQLGKMGIHEMFSGAPLPPMCVSTNAYLGAPGIVEALRLGADIVITGRVVDSAVVSAALVHEFGWSWHDYDKLAQAALAGHIIECGAQCTGGNFTDWRDVPDYEHIGFPIVEVSADSQFIVSKPEGSGGLVTPLTVGEQMLYEIGDPQRLSAARRGRAISLRSNCSNKVKTRCRCTAPKACRRPRSIQGQRDLARRFSLHRQLPDRRDRCGRQGPARQPGNHRQDLGNVQPARLGALQRSEHRTARQRGHLRSPRPAPGQPRSGDQTRRAPSDQTGADRCSPGKSPRPPPAWRRD